MKLSDFVAELLKAPSLSSMAVVSHALPDPAATREEAKALYGKLQGRIASNDRRNAVASLLVLLRCDGPSWLLRMRRDGVFRASRYGFDAGCLKKMVAAALELHAASPLPAEQVQYLESVQALLELAEPAKQLHHGIVVRLRARKGSVLKTLLAMVNHSFSIDRLGYHQADESRLAHWSATDLASAFSRIYMIARDELGADALTWSLTDDQAASEHGSVYSSILIDALRINELIDAEVLLDGLPYKAEPTTNGVLVSAIDPEFERSVRLGYVQTDLQMAVRMSSTLQELGGDNPKLPEFNKGLTAFLNNGLLTWVGLKRDPVARFVFAMPDEQNLRDFLNIKGPFLEEFPMLLGALLDNFQEPDSGPLQVSEHLTVMDLFRAQRLFALIDAVYRKKLETVTDPIKRLILMLRSTVVVLRRADVQKMLEVVMSAEQAQELISLLSLHAVDSVTGSDQYVDLQYRPFLQSPNSKQDYIAIAPAIVSKSNLVRSVMYSSKIKTSTAASDDPMQLAVAAALRQAGFLVRESFTFNIQGKRETDIFCYRDGVLVVIECKNAYHPCSPHELRNSYDLVLKAEEQLDIRAQWLAGPDNQKRLFDALGWEVATPAQVRTCVVTANRLFSGYRSGAHPVRQAHELINVLVNGYVGRGPGRAYCRFWRSEAFEVVDLLDYLDGKSVIQTQHAAMKPHVRSATLMGRRLEFAQYVIDLQEMDNQIADSFEPIQQASVA